MLSIDINDISLVTISSTKYIEEISSVRFNYHVDVSDNIQLEFNQGNPEYIALARLREYSNREGVRVYNDVYYRTRQGRSSGNNVMFNVYSQDGELMDYETRKIRRKAEVLQYKGNSTNKKINTNLRLSQYQLKLLRDTNDVSNCSYTQNGCSSIIYNKNIPYIDKL